MIRRRHLVMAAPRWPVAPPCCAPRPRAPGPRGRCASSCRLRPAERPTSSRGRWHRSCRRSSASPSSSTTRLAPGGNLGAAEVAKSPPDGHALLMGTVGTHAINAALYAKLPYDPIKEFAPITLVAGVPNVLVVNPQSAARYNIASVPDLARAARANPGKLNMASSGNGTASTWPASCSRP